MNEMLRQFALGVMRNNPNSQNDPRAQEFISALETNDAEKGRRLAQNMCNSNGLNPNDVFNKARNFFGF